MKKIIYLTFLIAFLFVGCSSSSVKKEVTPQPVVITQKNDKAPFSGSEMYQFYETGNGSWYGKELHGRATASGERFNMNEYTAAHKYLPFGTIVEVTNINTGKMVTARINDRGPFRHGRVLDLSSKAFSAIANTSQGVIPMEIRIISYPQLSTQ